MFRNSPFNQNYGHKASCLLVVIAIQVEFLYSRTSTKCFQMMLSLIQDGGRNDRWLNLSAHKWHRDTNSRMWISWQVSPSWLIRYSGLCCRERRCHATGKSLSGLPFHGVWVSPMFPSAQSLSNKHTFVVSKKSYHVRVVGLYYLYRPQLQ